MKTREEFSRKFRVHLAGLAVCGWVSERKDSPMDRAARVLDIPGEVDRLINAMYNYITESEEAKTNGAPKAPVNGVAQPLRK